MTHKENPFYRNYIFGRDDMRRAKIRWWDYPFLWFKTTYVQINEGYAFHYKLDSTGRVFLMDVEKLPPVPKDYWEETTLEREPK